MIKDKKIQYKRYSVKVSFMHYYLKCTRVMLPAVFEEFEMAYIFFLLSSFHYHYQLAKGKISKNQPSPVPPVSTGLYSVIGSVGFMIVLAYKRFAVQPQKQSFVGILKNCAIFTRTQLCWILKA